MKTPCRRCGTSMYATRWAVTPVEVTPQTKNGTDSSQSPTRITRRIGGGSARVTGRDVGPQEPTRRPG
jgi:hypothetical protein